MAKLSAALTNALTSDCAHSVEDVLKAKRAKDHTDLIELVSKDSANSEAKSRALFVLGRWGDSAAVAPIAKALPDLDEVGRVSAVDALGLLNTAKAMDAIVTMSDDSSPHVRKFVARALARFSKPKAESTLKTMEKIDQEGFVREQAKKSLSSSKKK